MTATKRRSLILLFAATAAVALMCACADAPGKRPEAEPTLPVITINTECISEMSRESWNTVTFSLADPKNPENNVSTICNQRIRGRGNTTWQFPKKPYRINFRLDVPLFGLTAHRNWVLLAEYRDPTFLMNATVFQLGREVFGLPYTCTYRHVHLYLDGVYQGVYGLTEHRQADPKAAGAPGRVKVDRREGWFAELDWHYDEEPRFRTTNYDLPIMIKSPGFGGNSDDPRYNFVKNDWNELCSLMASKSFPENGYRDLIDMGSFVDFLLVNEIAGNNELWFPKSKFFYRDKGGKIGAGPLWDFDQSFGYAGSGHTYFADDPPSSQGMRTAMHDFFRRFFEDPVFLAMYRDRWNEKYDEIAALSGFIESLGEAIRPAVLEDSKRWSVSGGYGPDYDNNHAKQTENMVKWWNSRVARLNAELNAGSNP